MTLKRISIFNLAGARSVSVSPGRSRLVGGPCAAHCAYGASCGQQRTGVTKGGNFEQFRAPTDIDRFGGELDDDALCQMLDSLEVSNNFGLARAAIISELDIAYAACTIGQAFKRPIHGTEGSSGVG